MLDPTRDFEPVYPLGESQIARLIFLLMLSIYLLTASLRIDSGDGETMFKVAQSLVQGNCLAISVIPVFEDRYGAWGKTETLADFHGGDGYGEWGRDQKYYAKYGLGWSLVAAPFILIGSALSNLFPILSEEYLSRVMVMLINPILTALTCGLLYWVARRWFDQYSAMSIALIYGIGTIAFYYAKSAFSEPLVTALLLTAIAAIYHKRLFLAGLALGYALITKQTALLLAVPMFVWGVYRSLRSGMRLFKVGVSLGLPILVGQTCVFWYNTFRFGNPLHFGYLTVAWDTPILLGITSILFSSGKGLFVFSPVLFLGLIGLYHLRLRGELKFSILIILSFLALHVFYSDWGGGGGWGSRLLLPIVPIMLLPAGAIIQKRVNSKGLQILLIFVLALSFTIQFLGVTVNWGRYLQRIFADSATPQEYFYRTHYRWIDSPILGQYRSLREVGSILRDPNQRERLRTIIADLAVQGDSAWQNEAVEILSYNGPDYWFFYFAWLGISPKTILMFALGLFMSVLITAVVLRKRIAYPSAYPV